MHAASILSARQLLVAAVLVGSIGVTATVVDPGARDQRVASEEPEPSTSSTSSPSSSTTTPSTTAPVETTTTTAPAPATTTPTTARPTTTTFPPLPVTTAPPTTTAPTMPSGVYPAGAARVLLVNETDVPLDIVVNQAWLRLAPGQTDEGYVIAELGATNRPAGEDLLVAAIPASYGLRDEGCGDHRLGQLIVPGKSYRIRYVNSGTCQLLGGGPKPTINLSAR